MKFGKTLKRISSSCDPEWSPYWLDYKGLKSKINRLHEVSPEQLLGKKLTKRKLCQDELETDFFYELHWTLQRTAEFYDSEMKALMIRYRRLQFAVRECHNSDMKSFSKHCSKCLQLCSQLYKDCVELETFAVTQYCGFGKILKKHDKNTG